MANGNAGITPFNPTNGQATEPCALGNQYLSVASALACKFDVFAQLFQQASILGKTTADRLSFDSLLNTIITNMAIYDNYSNHY